WRFNFGYFPIRFRPAQPRPAHLNQGPEPDSGAADDHDFHPAFGVLFRIYFPARNDALDFLRNRLSPPGHILHRTRARHRSARGNVIRLFLEYRPLGGDGPGAVHPLRSALQTENCLVAPVQLTPEMQTDTHESSSSNGTR